MEKCVYLWLYIFSKDKAVKCCDLLHPHAHPEGRANNKSKTFINQHFSLITCFTVMETQRDDLVVIRCTYYFIVIYFIITFNSVYVCVQLLIFVPYIQYGV